LTLGQSFMLASAADQLHVAICPTEIAYVRFARGLRLRPVAKGVLAVSGEPDGIPWRPAMGVLRAAIPALGPRRARVRVVLSNHFVRYMVVPTSGGPATARERERFIRWHFRQTHGDIVDAWHVCEHPDVDGMKALGCAVDAGLLAELTAILDRKPLRLGAVQPLLAAASWEFRHALGSSGCFFLHEPGGLFGGTYADGEWKTLSATSLALGSPVAAAIERQIDSGGLASEASIFLCAMGIDPKADGGLVVRRPLQVLQPPQRAGAAYGMALVGNCR
jgi:hypothetical protein